MRWRKLFSMCVYKKHRGPILYESDLLSAWRTGREELADSSLSATSRTTGHWPGCAMKVRGEGRGGATMVEWWEDQER